MSSPNINNSDMVRDVYKKSGLTYDEISRLCNIKRNTIACYITGQRSPDDITCNYIIEKISGYIYNIEEYINVTAYRDRFIADIFASCDPKTASKVINIFDQIPTVFIKNDKKDFGAVSEKTAETV